MLGQRRQDGLLDGLVPGAFDLEDLLMERGGDLAVGLVVEVEGVVDVGKASVDVSFCLGLLLFHL